MNIVIYIVRRNPPLGNGKVSDPDLVQHHKFSGPNTMRERIANIRVELTVNSLIETGAVVSISRPVEAVKKVQA